MPMNRLKIRKETRMLGFLFSGFFTILFERTRSRLLVSCTIALNILSACLAVMGVLLLVSEFFLFYVNSSTVIWPHKSGRLLSWYLFLFTILELIVSCTVTHWLYRAKYTGQ
uniref:Uncharacterized protein n=1 Tax=Molossus molossus TaxID=27622 RepID=A0A7J8ESC3_MOLMO|nr:hypothetical protein HJG59_012515 [Molossus molossus]